MKLIKKDSISNKCTSDRLFSSISYNLYGCLNRSFFNTTFKGDEYLNNDDYDWVLRGYYKEYDNSGVAINVVLEYPEFYSKINSLINNNWVNENTYYVISLINIYSVNLNKLIILKNTFELINENFIYNYEIKISDLESRVDIWFVLSIIFSVLCVVLELIQTQTIWKKSQRKYLEENRANPGLSNQIKDILKNKIFVLTSKTLFKI